jgi:triphosphoribosyl-dephospho-CoA synthase
MCAQAACILDVLTFKPGNVSLTRGFADMSAADLLLSAAAIGPVLENAPLHRIGDTILDCIRATRRVTKVNTNLGIVLLLAPLASVQPGLDLRGGVMRALMRLDVADARAVYEAIRMAQPGGLGMVDQQDVSGEPTVNLREAMGLAADRDLVARQYVNDFQQVFEGVEILREELLAPVAFPWPILKTYLRLLATHPDSHIARKFGIEAAREATRRARLALGGSDPSGVDSQALYDLKNWLSQPSTPRNPGTTADLITASLFVALRQNIIQLPFAAPFDRPSG